MHAHRLSLGLLAGWFIAVVAVVGYLLVTDRVEPLARTSAPTSSTTTTDAPSSTTALPLLTVQTATADTEAPPPAEDAVVEEVAAAPPQFTNIFGSMTPSFLLAYV